jgi:hypothetical protein
MSICTPPGAARTPTTHRASGAVATAAARLAAALKKGHARLMASSTIPLLPNPRLQPAARVSFSRTKNSQP